MTQRPQANLGAAPVSGSGYRLPVAGESDAP